jgi:putative transposase
MFVELLNQQDTWTTKEVRALISKQFDITYSLKQIRIILKNLGMRNAKPFPHDYRKPENSEDILKKTTEN